MKRIKKFLSILLVFCLVLSLCLTIILEVDASDDTEESGDACMTIWDGTVANSYAGGEGTESDPYQIANGAQLALLAQDSETKGKYFVLTSNIILNDLSNFENWEDSPPENIWTPIGTLYRFCGNFDGNRYTISGVYSDYTMSCIGLFGNVERATISNLSVKSSYVAGKECVGGIIGKNHWASLVENCHFEGTVVGVNHVGGIVGHDSLGTYSYCSHQGKVVGIDSVAGIVGTMSLGKAITQYCYNTGLVTGEFRVGGIAGGVANNDNAKTYIENCYNAGEIAGTNGYIGGIVGDLCAWRYIYNCYNVGKVTCINANGKVGGIAGNREAKTGMTNCYYLDTSAETDIGKGNIFKPNESNAKTKAEMSRMSTFSGFDFNEVWYIGQNSEYPYPELVTADTRVYAKFVVIDGFSNKELDDFSINIGENDLIYVPDEGRNRNFIVGTKSAFEASIPVYVSKDGYEVFLCCSDDLKVHWSSERASNNIIYMIPESASGAVSDVEMQLYVLEHVTFAKNDYTPFVQTHGFENAFWQFDNGDMIALANLANWMENVNEVLSLEIDGIQFSFDYYDLFVADLITTMVDAQSDTFMDVALIQQYNSACSFTSMFMALDDEKEQLFDEEQRAEWDAIIAGTSWEDVEADIEGLIAGAEFEPSENTEQLLGFVTKLMSPEFVDEHQETLSKIFGGFDILGEASDYICDAADSINAFVNTMRAYAVASTYADINEKLFVVLDDAAKEMPLKYAAKFKLVLEDYKSISTNKVSFFRRCLGELTAETIDFTYDLFVKDYAKSYAYDFIAAKLGCPVSVVQTIIAAYKIGYAVGDAITGLSDKAEQYTFMYYIAPLEAALETTVENYGKILIESPIYENAERYDYAYRTLAVTNRYLYNCLYTLAAAHGIMDIGQLPEVMEFSSSMIYTWKQSVCHGKANALANQYKYTSVQCPVDVYIYNEEGNLLVSVVDEEVVEYDSSVLVLISNNKKSFVYPADKNYSIRIISRSAGTMNYYVAEIGENSTRNVDFYNIELAENKQYTGNIPSGLGVERDEYALCTDNETISDNYDSNDGDVCLISPSDLVWKTKNASWTAVEFAESYIVYLYKDGEQIGFAQTKTNYFDWSDKITEIGWYTFNVVAVGDGVDRFNSRRSPFSEVFDYNKIDVESVRLNASTVDIKLGETAILTTTITPGNATDQNITWSSDNADVATVDKNGVVTAVSAGRATITATTEDGGFTASCVVTVCSNLFDEGQISTPSFETDSHDCPSLNFSDLDTSTWYHTAVDYVLANGIMKGTGDGNTFSPAINLTRGMMMTMLARLDGVDTEGGGIWYEKGMEWAVAEGVSDGTQPNGEITREQVVTMLYRFVGSPAVSGDYLTTFSDGHKVSSWAKDAMNWAITNGIIKGKGNNTLDPQGTATRVEVAQILATYLMNK